MDAVQSARTGAVSDPARTEPQLTQLLGGKHTVLARR
jgi:hypothetical protein